MNDKALLKIKRVYQPAETTDGYRILVDRLWPRGIRKEELKMDEWAKEVTPSTAIRKDFGHDPARFPEFETRYRLELNENPQATVFASRIQTLLKTTPVTLLYAARDETCNHALILRNWILEQ
mgnify:CR=1 FL=1